MLLELNISNFAIIDKLNISFNSGMTVFSGETGAGKSIILNALGLLCGEKFDKASFREQDRPVKVQALFRVKKGDELISRLDGLGLDCDDKECLIRREVSANGRNRCFVNGQLVRVQDLKELASCLVNIHSQHQTHQLLSAKSHFGFFCHFAGEDFGKVLGEYSKAYSSYKSLLAQQAVREKRLAEIESEKIRIEEDLKELEEAAIEPQEEEELTSRHAILVHGADIESMVTDLKSLFDVDNSGSLSEILSQMQKSTKSLMGLDSNASEMDKLFDEGFYAFEEFQQALLRYESQLSGSSEGELSMVEERLAVIERLKRKYGGSVEKVLEFEKEASEKLFELQNEEELFGNLAEEIKELEAILARSGERLKQRKEIVGQQLQNVINDTLKNLNMADASFKVMFFQRDSFEKFEYEGQEYAVGPEGFESLEFWLRSNQGQDYQPMVKIASGGEVSRVMLALKKGFASIHPAQTFIFDEIDTGIGGETGHKIADVLGKIAHDKQSIVITHLAQIAASADSHFTVAKSSGLDSTTSSITLLTGENRVKEIVRMMGMENTSKSLSVAKEMINKKK
jgi:DNA repair protein RecN (Recombination protein N)